MKLLAVERIKLFSTRSPYWCLALILVAALAFALLMGLITENGRQFASTGTSQAGMQLGMSVFMVLAALAVTTDYRFGTMRSTFLAAPKRTQVLAAKTAVVMVVGALIAVVSAFAAFFLTKLLATNPSAPLELATADQWRYVLGHAALYPIAGVIAIAVGLLVRQSAGAIALLLVWSMLVEQLVSLIPRFGPDVSPWLPFTAASAFVTDREAFASMAPPDAGGGPVADALNATGPTPLQGLLVFAAVAVVLWALAAVVTNRRDA
jgi:ABC-2 type transport system permease protein